MDYAKTKNLYLNRVTNLMYIYVILQTPLKWNVTEDKSELELHEIQTRTLDNNGAKKHLHTDIKRHIHSWTFQSEEGYRKRHKRWRSTVLWWTGVTSGATSTACESEQASPYDHFQVGQITQVPSPQLRSLIQLKYLDVTVPEKLRSG
jgi:hypothetical protein